MRLQPNFQPFKLIISNSFSIHIWQSGLDFRTIIKHGYSRDLINLDQILERYTSFWWYRMLGLDQNLFYDFSKCFGTGNDYNGMDIKFALENIFNRKYECLEQFIFRINDIIGMEAIKSSKKTYRKNELCRTKILERDKDKKIKDLKSCSKCSIKGCYKFGILFFVRS